MDLKRLSKHLGLSQTTVSRALNGYPDVSAATRERVTNAAREVGYSPNPLARRLAKGRLEAVGVIMSVGVGNFGDPFYSEFLAGVAEVFHQADMDLLVVAAPTGEEELSAYRRMVEGRRVDGLIVARTRTKDPRINYLLERNFPFVTFGRSGESAQHAFLDMDNEAGFIQVTERLIDFGHSRIALINAPEDLHFALLRRHGYERALRDAGLECDPELIVEGDRGEVDGHRLAERLLGLDRPPTALLCASDAMALGAMRAVKECGRTVGTDVSIIGYDDLPFAKYTEPPLTTLHQPIRPAGAHVAEMLLSRISGSTIEDLQDLWQPRLIVRESDGICHSK